MYRNFTLHDFIILFQNIANYHPNISCFDWGETGEFNSNTEDVYPKLYLETPISVSGTETTNTNYTSSKVYTISFYLLDRILESTPIRNNWDTVQEQKSIVISKSEITLEDVIFNFISKIKELNPLISSITYNYLSIENEFSDNTYGVRCELTLTLPYNKKCSLFNFHVKDIFPC